MNTLQDRIRGSLIGGAIGDALGYPVEFMSLQQIRGKYGNSGIARFKLNHNGVAEISDDTQMTLFTANGLLKYVTRVTAGYVNKPILVEFVTLAYKDWLQTQDGVENYNSAQPFKCWIRDIKELNSLRAPGNTCLSALRSLRHDNKVQNNSKGCGGVMRVAPVGLLAAADMRSTVKDYYGKEVLRREWNSSIVAKVGGDCAEITHKHPLGYLPAAFLADLIYLILMCDEPISFNNIEGLLRKVYADVKSEYTSDREQKALEELWALVEKAISQAGNYSIPDEFAISHLGEGWVGDEALAIAIYCTMKHLECYEDAISAAVNHSGDSDSTGAVTGNIMGAICGYEAIPLYYKENLELRWLIEEIADDITCGIPEGGKWPYYDTPEKRRWREKYVEGIWKDKVPIKNSYIVDRDLSIYAGEYPGDKYGEKAENKILQMYNFGVRHFVDLTEEGELMPYDSLLPADCTHTSFPIRDVDIPRSTDEVHKLIDQILELSKRKRGSVYIHCWGGVGRTGTIVACLYAYLMKDEGLSNDKLYERALKKLCNSFTMCPKSKYRITPETKAQCAFIRKFVENECK